jgi:hypothetical protein
VVNKTDIADAIGADLDVMAHDAGHMRGGGPTVFAQVKHGVGVDEIAQLILHARNAALFPDAHQHDAHQHSHSHSHGHSHEHSHPHTHEHEHSHEHTRTSAPSRKSM